MFYNLTPSVIPEFSAAQEKLAIWLVMVIGIAVAIIFGLLQCIPGFASFFLFGRNMEGALPELLLPHELENRYTFAYFGDLIFLNF